MSVEIQNLPEITTDAVIFTKEMCVQCDATKRAFTKLVGVTYDVVDIFEHEALVEELRSNGMLQMPLVVTRTGEYWQGFRPDRIKKLAV